MDHKARAIKPGLKRRKLLEHCCSKGSRGNENELALWAKSAFSVLTSDELWKNLSPCCFTRLEMVVIRISVDFPDHAVSIGEVNSVT
ncbi:hypothetical protein AVEN_13494-1 [Araneus ventricosus]|uniref:Uncharacterized protein n=1 Tax=Araneus ventricosus TaxID=182803 RepID=A0A4Y2MKT1_ARAVE|nr:hypothetical protein AVEN_13494-1 [Araneus ventricosus]